MKTVLATLKLIVLSLSVSSLAAFANWQLDEANSSLYFSSVKNNTIAETHTFNTFNGNISAAGKASLTIDLSSVDTNIGIRDERMQKFLFKTDAHPTADVTVEIDPALIEQLDEGSSKDVSYPTEVNLHGQSVKINVEFRVTKLSHNKINVVNLKPILVQANQFDLVAGVNKLQELAGLQSIDLVVPVNLNLIFTK